MKNHLLLFASLLLVLLVFRCTKDGTLEPGADTETDGKYLGLSDSFGSGSESAGSGNGDSTQQVPVEPGQITAAEWNDLENWDFWLNLGQNEDFNKAQNNWLFFPVNRYSVVVKDMYLKPLIDCKVVLKNSEGDVIWKACTDNEGKAELWLNMNGQEHNGPTIVVSYGDQEVTLVDPHPYAGGVNEVIFALNGNLTLAADILFVVDATGSMTDEIDYLKSELRNVVMRAESMNSALELRLGSVFYRDEGDEYLTRVSPFSASLTQTHAFIGDQHADGGGDYEEAVHTALNAAITQLEWSDRARARLIFLLLDAPPHHTASIVNDLNNIIKKTAEKGIKIIPISASGINKDTEFLFRFFATATNGTYVFITNDSGIGSEHIEATVGEYEVELLNDLMVRLIEQYTR
jgi:hypothetical protein